MIVGLQPEDGPVLVEVEYFIELERAHEFTKAMDDVRRERPRMAPCGGDCSLIPPIQTGLSKHFSWNPG